MTSSGSKDGKGTAVEKPLTARHRQAAVLHVQGVQKTDIAKTLGVNPNTISNYFKKPNFLEYIEELLKTVDQKIAERLADMTLDATSELHDMVRMPLSVTELTPAQKLTAITEALDRHKATSRIALEEAVARGDINIFANSQISAMSDEQLVAEARRIAEGKRPAEDPAKFEKGNQ